MPEKEPLYFREFRKHIDKRFDDADKKFATKDDLKSFATKDDLKSFATKDDLKSFATKDDIKLINDDIRSIRVDMKAFATKSDLELMETNFKQHITDLTSGFNDKIKGVCDHVASIDEKVTDLKIDFSKMDHKLTSIAGDVFYIKETLKEKADKSELLDIKKRVIRLESKFA